MKTLQSPFFKRTVGTLIYGAFFIWLFIQGGIVLLIGVSMVTVVATIEFYRMMSNAGSRPYYIPGILTALLFLVDAYLPQDILGPALTVMLLFSIAWMGIEEYRFQVKGNDTRRAVFSDWAVTLAGALYTGVLLSHVLLMRDLPDGARLLITVAIGAASCDITAYMIGSRLGRHPFAPRISPKKTWEGTISGFVAAAAMVSLVSSYQGVPPLQAVGWGLALATSQISGDLVESMIKRQAGVKDSGSLIPAQGGILDVIDGFMFSIAISYYYIVWVVLPT